MTANPEQSPISKAELLARFLGNALERDQEDIVFWRGASEAVRGRTLYRLLRRGKAMYPSVPHIIEEQNDAQRLVLTPGHVEVITVDE